MRLAAFVYAELAETSAALASLGEARTDGARRTYLEAVRKALATASGREVTTAGDAVLAVFGSASDALAFADSVQRALDRQGRQPVDRLDVRIGVAIGEVGPDLVSEERDAAAAVRAQQLARAAATGGVLASTIVAALASESGARFRPTGLIDMPGSPPFSAVEVTWDRREAEQPPLPAESEGRGSPSPFVGRAGELERLQAAWRSALSGERQLAFVVGEPGIGKTRLVAEFARAVHDQGGAVLWGRSFEEVLTPYQPFVQALQHHVRWTPSDVLRQQAGGGAAVLSRLIPELAVRIPVPSAAEVDPEGERYRLFEAVDQLFVACSADRPTLLVLDDLQWADQGTLLLLKQLLLGTSSAPLLIVGTYRNSEVGPEHPLALAQADLERDRTLERIQVTGLNEGEVSALVASLIGREPQPDVVQSLYGETAGNPLFLEEVVRHLQHLGLGAPGHRLDRVEAAVQELGVPERVRELVARRVQRLSAGARAALTSAAVIGSEFGSDVLAEVVGQADETQLVPALDEAVGARLLLESPDLVGSYRFSHALVQQAIYEMLTVNRRAALHERVARAVGHLHAESRNLDAELAYHHARAGRRHAADVVRHGRAAGEHALALFAYEDAVRDFTAALAAVDSLPGDHEGERAELLARLGTAHTRAGDFRAAREDFHRSAEISLAAGGWPLLAQAVLGYGGGAGFGGVWVIFAAVDEELVRLLELALAACPPGDCVERVRLLGRLAQALYWAPETERACVLSEEALAIARRLGDPTALAYALDSRHVVLWDPDHLDEGRAIAEVMLELGRRTADRDVQLEALAWLITDTLESDPLDVVDGFIAEHARIASELRQPYHLWYTEALHAMRAHLDGRFEEAAALCEKAYSYGRSSHGENALQTYLVQTMFIKLDSGHLEDLIDGLRTYVEASPLPAWHAALALALAGLDRREEALEQVEWFARRGFQNSIRRDCVWMTSMTALARAVAHFDDATHADELYGMLLPFRERVCVVGGAVLCLGPVSRLLGMLARTAHRPGLALEHFAEALERSRALESAPLVARTQAEAAKAHLMRGEAGDLGAARRRLDEAGALASRVGMSKLARDVELLRPQEVGAAR